MDTKHLDNKNDYYSIFGVMFSKTELPIYLIILILELLLAGVYFMNNNIIKIVVFILSCVVAVCIMFYLGFVIFTKQPSNILSADNKYFYLNGQKLENVYII